MQIFRGWIQTGANEFLPNEYANHTQLSRGGAVAQIFPDAG
jgi:hypothetical protein